MSKNHKKQNAEIYHMYGTHAVLSALANPRRKIYKIYVTNKNASMAELKKFQHLVEIVDHKYLDRILGPDQPHQGLAASVHTVFGHDINEIFKQSKEQNSVAILDQISDPQNIGAIIRSAAAFGVRNIILPKDHCPAENASIAKAASGCLELVKVYKITNIAAALEQFKKHEYWIAGLSGKGNNSISDLKGIKKIAVIIGAEGKGMRKLTEEHCDFLVKITIAPDVESLNASNAASIIFYNLQHLQ
jgi:23S rRNA (guanosine2251-2'-O)-methyltransferase